MFRASKRRRTPQLHKRLIKLCALAILCVGIVNLFIFTDVIGDLASDTVDVIVHVKEYLVDFFLDLFDMTVNVPISLLAYLLRLLFRPFSFQHTKPAAHASIHAVRVVVVADDTKTASLHAVDLNKNVVNCISNDGTHVTCTYLTSPSEHASVEHRPDAVVFLAQHGCFVAPRSSNYSHLRVYFAPPSDNWDACLDRHAFMANFDIEMSPRTCAQVPLYSLNPSLHGIDQLHAQPVEYTHKRSAVLHIPSSCSDKSHHDKVLQSMAKALDAAGVPLESKPCGQASSWQIQLMRRYKFCLVVESSSHTDYITRQLWDSLVAGCVPIYMGAPNILSFLPHPNAAIVYGPSNINSPTDLASVVKNLATDRATYESKLNWKKMSLVDYPSALMTMLNTEPATRCRLCQFLAHYKKTNRMPFTCLWNTSWLRNPGAPQLLAGLS